MEVKEAPEKIYVQLPSRKWIGRTWNETPIKEGDNSNWKNATNIEYTRTDALIEKACGFIETYPHLFMGVLRSEVIEDFKNYMKG